MEFVHKSIQSSLDVQILTGVGGLLTYIYKKESGNKVLLELLKTELIVQGLEAFIYQRLLLTSSPLQASILRYVDWYLTTPVMLLQLGRYMEYLNGDKKTPIIDYYQKHALFYNKVFLNNFLMLGTGLLAELKLIPRPLSTVVGFFFFFRLFDDLNKIPLTSRGKSFIQVQAIIWSLYGLADLLKSEAAQVSYSGLDLISKNFLGVYFSRELILSTKNRLT